MRKLGICLALNFENKGNHVYVCESSEQRIKDIQSGILNTLEPSVNDLLETKKYLYSLHETILNFDLYLLLSERREIQMVLMIANKFLIYFQRSPSSNKVKTILLLNCNVNYNCCYMPDMLDQKFTVAYSPEWVAQGSIIDNQLNPDVVVVGHHDKDIQRSIIELMNFILKICLRPFACRHRQQKLQKYYSIPILQ